MIVVVIVWLSLLGMEAAVLEPQPPMGGAAGGGGERKHL